MQVPPVHTVPESQKNCDFGSVKSCTSLSTNQFPVKLGWEKGLGKWMFFEWFIMTFDCIISFIAYPLSLIGFL